MLNRNGSHLAGCGPCRFHAGSLTGGHAGLSSGFGTIGGTPDFGAGDDLSSFNSSLNVDVPTVITGATGAVDAFTKEGDLDVPQLISGAGTFIAGLFGSDDPASPMDDAQQQGIDAEKSIGDQIGDAFRNIFLEPAREANQTTQDRISLFASGGAQSQFLGLTPLGIAAIGGGIILFLVLRK